MLIIRFHQEMKVVPFFRQVLILIMQEKGISMEANFMGLNPQRETRETYDIMVMSRLLI